MTKPSFRETLLIWLVLTFTAWNALRAWTSFSWRNVLSEYSPQPGPAIITVSSMIWLIVGLVLIWSIWQNKAWAWKLLFGAAAGYTVWFWSERLIWQNPHPNWLFAVIVNLAIIIFILFIMKSLMREAYERKNENPKVE